MQDQKMIPLPFSRVTFEDDFWAPRIAVNRARTIPAIYRQLQKGGIDNWRQPASGGGKGSRRKHIPLNVATVGKWIEAVAYELERRPDPRWSKKIGAIVSNAFGRNGFLRRFCRFDRGGSPGKNYFAGHLIEAAIAWHRATGRTDLIARLRGYADRLAAAAGAGGKDSPLNKLFGHPGMELALVRLYRHTGSTAYLRLAERLIDARGRRSAALKRALVRDGASSLEAERKVRHTVEHVACRKLSAADGHAVCLLYLLCGMADVALETGDGPLLDACRRVWRNIADRRMYITGGTGSSHSEEFSYDYDLANENPSAYAETCAAIGLFLFAHRMLRHESNGRYADAMERALYNGVLSGVSLDGTLFNYMNPLAVYPTDDRERPKKWCLRQSWFTCPCCPPNVARLLASLGGYIYRYSADSIWVDLYAASRANIPLPGQSVRLRLETAYPWRETARLEVKPAKPAVFTVAMRIPAWCRRPGLKLNGRPYPVSGRILNGYISVRREWSAGDILDLSLPMPVERVQAHPSVRHDCGRVALQRGPVVYCFEEADNGPDLNDLVLPGSAPLTARFEKKLLGGVVTLSGTGLRRDRKGWGAALYRTTPARQRRAPIKAVPYYAWHNRKEGEMLVWIRHE